MMVSLRNFLIMVVIVGILCRFVGIDTKLFSHDEVYTSLRSSGYSSEMASRELFDDVFVSAKEVLKFQQIKPNSSIQDTIVSLATEDPQHPPLYFLLNRWWIEVFGSSVLSVRLLPAIFSTIAVFFMYLLAEELFANSLASWLASAFFAFSPFDVLFAQISRQYSLLTLMVIVSSYLLLRSLRLSNQKANWWFYCLSLAVGLYVHPFFTFTIVAHGGYLLAIKEIAKFRFFIFSVLGAVILFSPWAWVILTNLRRALGTTNWTGSSPDWLFVPKLWVLSFTALFIDLDVGIDNPFTYILRLPFLILFWWSVRSLFQNNQLRAGWFIIANFAIPFLILVIPDIITGGRRSSVSRYLISCFPAIQLAVAYLFSCYLNGNQKNWWRVLLAICFSSSLISIGASISANTWWTNVPSYFNANTAEIINTSKLIFLGRAKKEGIGGSILTSWVRLQSSKQPLTFSVSDQGYQILFVDQGNDGTNFGDMISLAYRLKPNVYFHLIAPNTDFNLDIGADTPPLFVFRPSGKLRSSLTRQGFNLSVVDRTGGDLWTIEK
jgi:uncharacterized membrane protein